MGILLIIFLLLFVWSFATCDKRADKELEKYITEQKQEHKKKTEAMIRRVDDAMKRQARTDMVYKSLENNPCPSDSGNHLAKEMAKYYTQ